MDLPVIGIGGISSLEDALEFFIAGACAVQVGTWNFINPRITLDIIEGLEKYMREHHMKKLSEIRGSPGGQHEKWSVGVDGVMEYLGLKPLLQYSNAPVLQSIDNGER